MKRSDREIRDPGEIGAILSEAQVCRIAMADDTGPYIVPVCFGTGPGALYIHSAQEGTKITMIRRNPRVCFEVDLCDGLVKGAHACSWGMRYRSVIGFGTAKILDNPEEKKNGLSCIMQHYEGAPCTFTDDEVLSVAVIRIAIESMTGKMSKNRSGSSPVSSPAGFDKKKE